MSAAYFRTTVRASHKNRSHKQVATRSLIPGGSWPAVTTDGASGGSHPALPPFSCSGFQGLQLIINTQLPRRVDLNDRTVSGGAAGRPLTGNRDACSRLHPCTCRASWVPETREGTKPEQLCGPSRRPPKTPDFPPAALLIFRTYRQARPAQLREQPR